MSPPDGPGPRRPLRVLIAPDSFKGSIDAAAAAAAIGAGWASVRPADEITTLPLADGGEGTLDVLGAGLPASARRSTTVPGPDGRPVDAPWLLRPDGTAVVELATAAGLPQMAELDPLGASTDGLGKLLRAVAADPATRRIVLTLGGSATTDGGSGVLRGLGARLLDADGADLPPGGGALARLDRIDLTGLVAAPPGGVTCLVDVTNPLLGEHGAAAVFGPQKGASPEQVALLDAALTRWADVLDDVLEPGGAGPGRDTAGTGAAGGTAFGLLSCWPGTTRSGARTVAETVGLGPRLAAADVVITGEGKFDDQSLHGKVVGTVLAAATEQPTGVFVVAGMLAGEPGPPALRAVSLSRLAGSPQESLADPARWLGEAGALLAGDGPLLARLLGSRAARL